MKKHLILTKTGGANNMFYSTSRKDTITSIERTRSPKKNNFPKARILAIIALIFTAMIFVCSFTHGGV